MLQGGRVEQVDLAAGAHPRLEVACCYLEIIFRLFGLILADVGPPTDPGHFALVGAKGSLEVAPLAEGVLERQSGGGKATFGGYPAGLLVRNYHGVGRLGGVGAEVAGEDERPLRGRVVQRPHFVSAVLCLLRVRDGAPREVDAVVLLWSGVDHRLVGHSPLLQVGREQGGLRALGRHHPGDDERPLLSPPRGED